MSVPHLLSYSSAKFALEGFSEGLHSELAKEGIHVLTVAPWLDAHRLTGQCLRERKTRGRIYLVLIGSHIAFYINECSNGPRSKLFVPRNAVQTQVIITFQATLLDRFHALFPRFDGQHTHPG